MKCLSIAVLIFLIFISCQKNDVPKTTPKTVTVSHDVYVAGFEENSRGLKVAKYWKNGVAVSLSDGSVSARANSIIVSNDDVYVAGWDENSGLIWKNGVPTKVNGGFPQSMFMVDGDIYLVGSGRISTGVTYWKNGLATALTDGNDVAQAFCMAVSNNDVYVAGFEGNSNGVPVAKYWKNGAAVALTDGNKNASANSILISGNDVYVAGFEQNLNKTSVAKYWKNGVAVDLTDGVNFAECYAMTASGDDLYFAGYESHSGIVGAKYWKNNVSVSISNGNKQSIIYGISVMDSDVYAAGYEYISNSNLSNTVALYWKNGIANALTNGATNASALSIFVK